MEAYFCCYLVACTCHVITLLEPAPFGRGCWPAVCRGDCRAGISNRRSLAWTGRPLLDPLLVTLATDNPLDEDAGHTGIIRLSHLAEGQRQIALPR